MTSIYGVIVEGILQSLKMFDSEVLNSLVYAFLIYITYVPSYKLVHSLYGSKIINTRESGSQIHWITRCIFGYILFWVIKFELVIILFVNNRFMQGILMSGFIFAIYYILKYTCIERIRIKESNA